MFVLSKRIGIVILGKETLLSFPIIRNRII